MTEADEFRRRAAEAEATARMISLAPDREALLRIAQEYRRLEARARQAEAERAVSSKA